ncbi:MAG: GNAT family N-acetyltransferase [Candidatus Neomarinimicrobiota bacterium]
MLEINRFYPDSQTDIWDEIVLKANNGTIFHTRKFLSYHPEGRFQDHSLIFTKKSKPYALFPAAEISVSKGTQLLVSHPGASYGSFVVPADLSFVDSQTLVTMLKSYSSANGFTGIRLTMPPTIYNKRLSNYMDFALLKNGFHYEKREISSILFLEKSVKENLAKFRPSHRQAVRKAQRQGVIVEQSENYSDFYTILKNNLKIRHGVSPTHTLDELMLLKSLFPEQINLFGAFSNGKMIAGVLNFICNNDVVLAFYISHDEKYQEIRALNLLFYFIFEWAIENRFKVFDFGIFTVREEPNIGLARFKENFGASGMFRDTFLIQWK